MSRIVDLTSLRFEGPHPRPRDIAVDVGWAPRIGEREEERCLKVLAAHEGVYRPGSLDMGEVCRLELARREALES